MSSTCQSPGGTPRNGSDQTSTRLNYSPYCQSRMSSFSFKKKSDPQNLYVMTRSRPTTSTSKLVVHREHQIRLETLRDGHVSGREQVEEVDEAIERLGRYLGGQGKLLEQVSQGIGSVGRDVHVLELPASRGDAEERV